MQRIVRLDPLLPDLRTRTRGVLSILLVDSVSTHSLPSPLDVRAGTLEPPLAVGKARGLSLVELLARPTAIKPKIATPIKPAQPPAAFTVEFCPTIDPVGPVSTKVFFFSKNPSRAAP